MDDQNYSYLKRKILKLTKIDLDDYKSQQMRRRLDNFIQHAGVKSVVDYGHMLEDDRNKLQELLDFITINVSEFYRDTAMFSQLQTRILPDLVNNTMKLNVWSAGCSRGQEAYSLAIMLESMSARSRNYRILASDIDDRALSVAMAGGPYGYDDIKSISPELLERYFTCSGKEYRIIDRMKKKLEFKKQNLLLDEFEKDFDLIVCRNVTIYFTDKAKRDLNTKFFNSLKEGGVMFIGGTEVMLDASVIGFENLGVSFYRKPVRGISLRPAAAEKLAALNH